MIFQHTFILLTFRFQQNSHIVSNPGTYNHHPILRFRVCWSKSNIFPDKNHTLISQIYFTYHYINNLASISITLEWISSQLWLFYSYSTFELNKNCDSGTLFAEKDYYWIYVVVFLILIWFTYLRCHINLRDSSLSVGAMVRKNSWTF